MKIMVRGKEFVFKPVATAADLLEFSQALVALDSGQKHYELLKTRLETNLNDTAVPPVQQVETYEALRKLDKSFVTELLGAAKNTLNELFNTYLVSGAVKDIRLETAIELLSEFVARQSMTGEQKKNS